MRYRNSIAFTQESIEQNTKRILIIEQSESVGILYKSILLQHEYTILTATSGQEAIDLLDSFQPNLIITTDTRPRPEWTGYNLSLHYSLTIY